MNILYIMADSLAPHDMGAYGDAAARTPNLDQLAASGVTFDRAYCNSPLCAPSRASMVAGRYVSELGAFDNADSFRSEVPTIGHVLGAAGYETAIIGKMHFVGHDQHHGFDQRLALETDYTSGYSEAVYKLAYDWAQPSAGNPAGGDWMGESYVKAPTWDNYTAHYDRDEIAHSEALAYLRSKGPDSSPFFACVSYHAPHNPFWIPDRFKQPFAQSELPVPRVSEGMNTCHGIMDTWLNDFHYVPEYGEAMMTPANLRWLYENYYGMVYYLDSLIGELLALLDERGLTEKTAIVFASDHGDMLAHRGMLQKRYFYERSARVPVIVRMPGGMAGTAGTRRPELISLLDLLPTFAAMAGAPIPDDLPGMNLLPAVVDGRDLGNRTVFCEYHGEGVHAPCFMARKGDFKYLYVHGHEERLYNVAEDPEEFEPLPCDGERAGIARELKEAVLAQFDPDAIAAQAVRSQQRRGFVYRCHRARVRETG